VSVLAEMAQPGELVVAPVTSLGMTSFSTTEVAVDGPALLSVIV
jgi:hypothetical protein